ncbi:gamma-butyrobetaine dioxygenase [Battus philenor]|uniref:gamma-butyrobetaine dioxygenase n=1 Tax=Battus philenor TaxID=42288 RepID=UPI0035CE9570
MLLIKKLRSVSNLIESFKLNLNKNSLIRNASSYNNDILALEVKGETLKFPYVWLRDNCKCEKCFHPTAKSRILDWSKFDINAKPKDITKHEDYIHVTWNDGHVSTFGLNWLKFRSFTPENQHKYTNELYKPSKVTWKGENFNQVCRKHDYSEIISSDEALLNWLKDTSVYGVSLIQNTPDNVNSIDDVVKRIGFPKQTHYGVRFIVQNVANTSNVAYLSSNLQMHTDLPYYEYCPGVNLLHCLVQTKSLGGENTLSDCHYIANYMKQNHHKEYEILTDTEVEWSDIGTENGNEFYKLYRSPVISLDKHGEVIRVNFSIPQRGNHFPGPIEQVKPWYEAYSLFYKLNQQFSAKFKVDPGNILVFDNIRMLHGRSKYQDSEDNIRKLIGVYVDWDEIYSRIRSLKVKLNNETLY